MTKKKEHIELRSDEVKAILGTIPNWLTRWGITLIFVVIASLFIVAAFVPYPEIVKTDIQLTSTMPPVPVVAKTNGNIAALFVQEGDTASASDILAIINNTAYEEDIFLIEENIRIFLTNPENSMDMHFPKNPTLGPVQEYYASFLQYYNEYQFFEQFQVASTQSAYLSQQIQQYRTMNQTLMVQMNSCIQELSELKRNMDNDKKLYENGILSQRDFQKSQTAYYAQKTACEDIQLTLSANDVRIQDYQKQIFELGSSNSEERIIKYTQLTESARQLKTQIENWKEQYVLIAPVDGVVSFHSIWSNNQYIEANDAVLSIIQDGGEFLAFADISNTSLGKVRAGQDVYIKLDAYDFMEYGIVRGKVQSIALAPVQNTYQVQLDLPNKLMTSTGKDLFFTQGMTGKADIIIEKKSVLATIFSKFQYLLHKN